MILHRGYKFRLYPTPEQAARLRAWEGALRFLWNVALRQRLNDVARCKVDRCYPNAVTQSREVTVLRAELPWLADVPRHACTHVVNALDAAWERCYAGLAERPTFKRKGCDTVGITEFDGAQFRVAGDCRNGAVKFPRIGTIRAAVHRTLVGIPKRATIRRDGDQWFVSVLVQREVPDPAPSMLPPVGVDRGVAALVATSDGEIVQHHRAGAKMQAKIAKAQRDLTRKAKGSKNRAKARAKVARLQRKARRQREHVLHAVSLNLAKNHGTVVMEKLDVEAMTASAKGTVEEPGVNVAAKAGLNRAILDAGWGRLATFTRYKLAERGGRFVEVSPHHTSQTCAECGVVDAGSRASQSEFRCTACGHADNADVNAARVILARGLAAPVTPEKVRVTLRKRARRKFAA